MRKCSQSLIQPAIVAVAEPPALPSITCETQSLPFRRSLLRARPVFSGLVAQSTPMMVHELLTAPIPVTLCYGQRFTIVGERCKKIVPGLPFAMTCQLDFNRDDS